MKTIEENKIDAEQSLTNDFPSVNQILSHTYPINIACLIDTIKEPGEAGKIEAGLVQMWVDKNNTQSMILSDNDIESLISTFSMHLSKHYRKMLFIGKNKELLYLSWSRIAANAGNAEGMFNLLKYANSHQCNKKHIIYWGQQAFKKYTEQVQHAYAVGEMKKKTKIMHEITCMISSINPAVGLSMIFELLKLVQDLKLPKGFEGELKSHSDSLIKNLNGVRILDSIGLSDDRTLQRTCERYRSLTVQATPLIKTPDICLLKKTLDIEFPWFNKLTYKICQQLLIRQLGNGVFYLPPTLILGQAGLGKTSYINRLSVLVNIPFRMINLAGKNDNKSLTGTARGWSTGEPSSILSFINDKQIANPIFLLDEIDKAGGSSHNGRVHDTLLTMFEPSSSTAVFDEFICGHADLSNVTWLCTANDVSQLPTTLLSRMDVITVEPPKAEHYPAIVNSTINSFCQRNGINKSHIPIIKKSDWEWLKKYYSTPRKAKRATEMWLSHALLNPSSSTLN